MIQGGGNITENSRAEYFKNRRKKLKQFSVMLEKEKVEALENELNKMNITKTAWLKIKIDEELSKK